MEPSPQRIVLPLPVLPTTLTPNQLSPASLAYFGDAVYELFIRFIFLSQPQRINDYHQQVVAHVRAETQAHYLDVLREHFTSHELDILRQGRNAATAGPRRVSAKIYRQATGLETLLGYLYLWDQQRLQDILFVLWETIMAEMATSQNPSV